MIVAVLPLLTLAQAGVRAVTPAVGMSPSWLMAGSQVSRPTDRARARMYIIHSYMHTCIICAWHVHT